MRAIRLGLAGLWPGRSIASFERTLERLLEIVIDENVEWRRAHPDAPLLYESGVRYERDELTAGEDVELWVSTPELYELGAGDCEDLVATRVGELRAHGIRARAIWTRAELPDGDLLYHVQVELPDGSIEDPAAELGMETAA